MVYRQECSHPEALSPISHDGRGLSWTAPVSTLFGHTENSIASKRLSLTRGCRCFPLHGPSTPNTKASVPQKRGQCLFHLKNTHSGKIAAARREPRIRRPGLQYGFVSVSVSSKSHSASYNPTSSNGHLESKEHKRICPVIMASTLLRLMIRLLQVVWTIFGERVPR